VSQNENVVNRKLKSNIYQGTRFCSRASGCATAGDTCC